MKLSYVGEMSAYRPNSRGAASRVLVDFSSGVSSQPDRGIDLRAPWQRYLQPCSLRSDVGTVLLQVRHAEDGTRRRFAYA